MKLVATASCYASGNAGGIFGPSLFFGAMLGATVGTIAHHFLPGLTASPGAYALVGMGALFAGIIRVPLTSVFMIFELTRDYAIVVPLMIANLVSFSISRRLQHVPIYEALALQDGIRLPKPARSRGDSQRRVAELMKRDFSVVQASTPIAAIAGTAELLAVVDDKEAIGALSRSEVLDALAKGKGHEPVSTLLPVERRIVHLHSDHSAEDALERLQDSGLQAAPVLDRSDARVVQGVITLKATQTAFGIRIGEGS